MIKNEKIICISSIDWDFVWQGHQEMMSTFANNGNKVLFIENTGVRAPSFRDMPRLKKRLITWFKSLNGFRKETENLFIYSPIILPYPYSRLARAINRHLLLGPIRRWMKITNFHDPIVWTFLPTGTALDIADGIDKKLLVYYCIADFYELVDNPRKVKKTEDELISKCDLVFAQGEVLANRCRRLNDNVHIFPFGVKMDAFEDFQKDRRQIPADITGIPGPIVGYIGGIHRHIDFGLIAFIANAHPEWSIVLIGPIQTDISKIANLKNIFFLGKKDIFSLPDYINRFNVGIIPYQVNSYTETVYPTKLNEYYIMGKPAVSTDLPELANLNVQNENIISIGKTYQEFTGLISAALKEESGELKMRRISLAKKNNWSGRIEKMSALVEKAVDRKNSKPIDWSEELLKLFRRSRARVLKLSVWVLGIYFILFHTSFIWFVAGPLKVSDIPAKSDAIVVFAGGVGESGQAGQGYEERVQCAANLYKEGLADKVIFSSGYKYAIKETELLKTLAVFLGIPEAKIILEENAVNTYENVQFTKKILLDNHLRSVLFVSSPYHMRRALMVFKKNAPQIHVKCIPIPGSLFYKHDNGAALYQVNAIFHEYLGIVYYWFKGRV